MYNLILCHCPNAGCVGDNWDVVGIFGLRRDLIGPTHSGGTLFISRATTCRDIFCFISSLFLSPLSTFHIMASILRRVSTNPAIQAAARPSAAYLKSAIAHPRTIAPMWRFMTTGSYYL